MKFLTPRRRIVGLAPGETDVRAVVIDQTLLTGTWSISGSLKLPRAASLSESLKSNGVSADQLALNVSAPEVVRATAMPAGSEPKLGQMVRFELDGLFPRRADVAYAHGVAGRGPDGIWAIMAGVERRFLTEEIERLSGARMLEAVLTTGLSVYQGLHVLGALSGRALAVYIEEHFASVMYMESGELNLLRSFSRADHPNVAAEVAAVIARIQKKWEPSSTCLALYVGDDAAIGRDIASRVGMPEFQTFSHPKLDGPRDLVALGAAAALLPNGLGLNFISGEERAARHRASTRKSRIALAVLPAVLIGMGANVLHLRNIMIERDIAAQISSAAGDLQRRQEDVQSVRAAYESNERAIRMIRQSGDIMRDGVRWSAVISELAQQVPADLTLEAVNVEPPSAARKSRPADSSRRRAYAGMDAQPSAEAGEPSSRPLSLAIEGYAYEFDPINDFISNLEKCDLFEEIRPAFETKGLQPGKGRPASGSDDRIYFNVTIRLRTPRHG